MELLNLLMEHQLGKYRKILYLVSELVTLLLYKTVRVALKLSEMGIISKIKVSLGEIQQVSFFSIIKAEGNRKKKIWEITLNTTVQLALRN